MAVGIIATLRVVDGKQAEFEAGFAKMQEVVKPRSRGVCSMPCVRTRRTPQPIGLWNNMQMKMRVKATAHRMHSRRRQAGWADAWPGRRNWLK